MEKRVFLAVAVCIGIFVAWNRFYIQPIVDAQNAYKAQSLKNEAERITKQSLSTASEKKQTIEKKKAEILHPETFYLSRKGFDSQWSTQGAVIERIKIDEYNKKSTENVFNIISAPATLSIDTNAQDLGYLSNVVYKLKNKTETTADLSYEDERVKISKKISLSGNHTDVLFNIEFISGVAPSFVFVNLLTKKEVGDIENEKRSVMIGTGSSVSTHDVHGFKDTVEDTKETDWVGVSSRYFLSALVNSSEKVKPNHKIYLDQSGVVKTTLAYRVQDGKVELPLKYYYGPKEIDQLKQVSPKLSSAVDFGWFTFFAYPLLEGLKWLYKYVHNFGLAIILLTLFVKLITYPLTYKSMKSMKDMQRIQPQLAKIREKYADDKEKLNKEMLQLMKSNGYNPVGGCFPVLVQMPIFIALYNVLFNSIELYGQPFFGWIADLSQKDPYFVTPVLLGLVMFIQQKMTPSTATDPAQQKMMNMMPIIFGAMMLWLPAGLTLYMLVNSVASIAQQVMVNRTFEKRGLA